MRVTTIALVALSTTLAVTAFQFHREVQRERSRADALALQAQQLQEQLERRGSDDLPAFDVERRDELGEPLEAMSPPGSARVDPTRSNTTDPFTGRPGQGGMNRNRFDDPEFRALAFSRQKQELRRRNVGLAKELGLSSDQEDALLDLLASQMVERQALDMQLGRARNDEERRAQRAQIEALRREQEQQLQAQVGYTEYERLRAFQQQAPERQVVSQLKGRLDETSGLRDDQVRRLTTAMLEERELYQQQTRAIDGFGGYMGGYPFVAMPRGGDSQTRLRFAEEQVGRTEAFLQRVRQRASTILTNEQMKTFDQLQEEQLTQAREFLDRLRRREERARRG